MSLDFKLHYDRLREGDPTKSETAATTNEEGAFYEGPSHARNLCLVWPDGRRQFLNYAYLLGGELILEDDNNTIILNFSTYIVKLKGYRLEMLFKALCDNVARQIVQVDARYVHSLPNESVVVTEIDVTPV